MRRSIFLLTDFGSRDYYVSAMKSVIFSINPDVNVIDVSHEVSKWNVLEGAFILWQLIQYTPRDAIIVGVVDPGVGGERREIVIITEAGRILIGPDNGLLYPAAIKDGIKEVWFVKRGAFPNASPTFHGRDIFAPLAGYLSVGRELDRYAKKGDLREITKLELFDYIIEKDEVKGRVLHIDDFGNIVTNIPCSLHDQLINTKNRTLCIIKNSEYIVWIVRTFSELEVNELGLICGSSNLIEIVSNKAKAAEIISRVRPGDPVVIKL